MHRQLADWIPIVDRHDFRPLFHLVLSDPSLDRDLKLLVSHRRVRKHLIKEHVQIIRIKQKSRTFLLRSDRPRRTAKIQVDLPVSHLCKLLCRQEKIPCPVRQNLGHHRHTHIILRQHIPHLLHTHPLLRPRCQKRRKIFLHTTKILVVQVPVRVCCDSL